MRRVLAMATRISNGKPVGLWRFEPMIGIAYEAWKYCWEIHAKVGLQMYWLRSVNFDASGLGNGSTPLPSR